MWSLIFQLFICCLGLPARLRHCTLLCMRPHSFSMNLSGSQGSPSEMNILAGQNSPQMCPVYMDRTQTCGSVEFGPVPLSMAKGAGKERSSLCHICDTFTTHELRTSGVAFQVSHRSAAPAAPAGRLFAPRSLMAAAKVIILCTLGTPNRSSARI